MKIKLFIAASLVSLGFFGSAQLVYVGNAATVTVLGQTLMYDGGGFHTVTGATVNNSGNIMVNAVASDIFKTDGTFNLTLSDINNYGQLYISGIPQNNITGKVNKAYRSDSNASADGTASQQIGLPFYHFPVDDLNTAVGGYLNTTVSTLNSAGRWNPSSFFKWNSGKARFDQIVGSGATAYVGGPLDYYIIPRRNSAGTIMWDAAGTTKIFSGQPTSDNNTSGETNYSIVLSGAYAGSFGTNGNASNYFQEKYYSYIDDPFSSKSPNWDADYGKNLYQVANPFLTNIDLKYIGRDESVAISDDNYITNLYGVAYYTGGLTWDKTTGTNYVSKTLTKVNSANLQAGDLDLIIKPMGEFMIKLSSASSATLNFNKTRRFAQTSRLDSSTSSGPTAKTEDDDDIPADKIVKQIAVVMYDPDDLEIGRTYYAISPTAVTGHQSGFTTIQAYNNGDIIFTKEELPNGGEDANFNDLLYINEANETDFKKKKIPLYIDYQAGAYYLKFEVYEKGQRVSNEGLSSGENFYIETSANSFVKLNDGDVLSSLSGEKSLGLYYGKPSSGTLDTNSASLSQTIIAKKDSQWVVRFAKNWNSAKVEVYSAAGQLINSKSQISTQSDYSIPLSSQVKSVFIVKAISENGEIVTKKIIN